MGGRGWDDENWGLAVLFNRTAKRPFVSDTGNLNSSEIEYSFGSEIEYSFGSRERSDNSSPPWQGGVRGGRSVIRAALKALKTQRIHATGVRAFDRQGSPAPPLAPPYQGGRSRRDAPF